MNMYSMKLLVVIALLLSSSTVFSQKNQKQSEPIVGVSPERLMQVRDLVRAANKAKTNKERGKITAEGTGKNSPQKYEKDYDKIDSLVKELQQRKTTYTKVKIFRKQLEDNLKIVHKVVPDVSDQQLSKAALTFTEDHRIVLEEITPGSEESKALYKLGEELSKREMTSINEMLSTTKTEENNAKKDFVDLCKQMQTVCAPCASQNGCDEVLK